MTNRRLNKAVNALRSYLSRQGVSKPDKVAKLLIDERMPTGGIIHLTDKGTINISSKGPFSQVIGKGLSTTDLRNQLLKAGVIIQISFSGYEQWTVKTTPKLEEYRARFKAECEGQETAFQALSTMETRIDKKLAAHSNENKELKADQARTKAHVTELEGLLAQTMGQLNEHAYKLTALEEAIRYIEKHDAPITSEKIERHLKAV